MVSIGEVAQHLLNLGPQNNLSRQAFYHFLKNFYPLESAFRQEMIDAFYDRAMTFNFWQNQKEVLGTTLQKDLLHLNTQLAFGFDIRQLVHIHELQWIWIERAEDMQKLLQRELSERKEAGGWSKLIPLENQQWLCLLGSADGSLQVEIRNQLVVIEQAELLLTRPITQLHYDAQLELARGFDQILADSALSCLKFQVTDRGFEGVSLQGHSFQKTPFKLQSLGEHPELFYTIKGLERYFIDAQTDPFYQEIAILLEKALRLFNSRHPDALVVGHEALKRGRMAVKKVFPNDKELRILLIHLENQLRQLESWQKPVAKPVSPAEDQKARSPEPPLH